MRVSWAAAVVDDVGVGIHAIALAAIDEARLMVPRGGEAENRRRVAALRRGEAGQLQRDYEVVRRTAGERVDVARGSFTYPREDDRSRVVGLIATVARSERLCLDSEGSGARLRVPAVAVPARNAADATSLLSPPNFDLVHAGRIGNG